MPQGFVADSRQIVVIANEPGHQARNYLFDATSSKLQAITDEGISAPVTPDGRFLVLRHNALHPELRPIEGGSPGREIKAWQDKDRAIQVTVDGKVLFVVNYNGLSAAIYRLHLDSGDRQLVKTLGMRDSTGGFGVTRVVTTPDGQYFAYNTLRQLSELYLLQGLY